MASDGESDSLDSRNIEPTGVTPPNKTAASDKRPARFAFVDGLRGFAALCIVIFHIWWYEPPPYPTLELVPGIVELGDAVLLRIRGGVQILLVISGFVIAFTLRNLWVTPSEIVSFVKRRLVRLVPAYWFAIGFVILTNAACVRLWELPSAFEEPLSASRVLAHALFLQDVLGHKSLSAGMWTVCIEMQFYIFAVLGWGLAQRLIVRPDTVRPCPSVWGLLLTFAPLASISLFYWHRQASTEPWIIHFISFFFLGMMTWWALNRTVSVLTFFVTIAVVAEQLAYEWEIANAIALTTALLIFVAGKTNRLHVWLNWTWLQYFGRISYSLYLIHYSVCHLLISLGWKWCGNTPTPAQASAVLLASFVASIAAGHLLYLSVEAPSARWAARMKRSLNLADLRTPLTKN